MPIDFPDTPTLGDDYTIGTTTWTYDGTKWVLKTYNSLHAVPVGAMLDWAPSSNIPNGWMLADGSAISRTQYADLFAEIGTTYGTGDGSTTFNLPNILASPGSPVTLVKVTTGGAVEPSSISHAVEHVRGGNDVVDGDRVQLDWVPSNYTRDSAPSEAGGVTDLTAHLKGIDNRFVGYTYVDTLYYTTVGTATFSKATYPWLRAIRVRCIGGGGAGGGTAGYTGSFSACGGGGGGAYSESFITDIAGLASSVTVTVGAGGAGVSAATGNNGGTTSFGALVVAVGGVGSASSGSTGDSNGGDGGAAASGTGDLRISGAPGNLSNAQAGSGSFSAAGNGGPAGGIGGGGGRGPAVAAAQNNGVAGGLYGGGGSGAVSRGAGVVAAGTGGNGAQGIVIVELYA